MQANASIIAPMLRVTDEADEVLTSTTLRLEAGGLAEAARAAPTFWVVSMSSWLELEAGVGAPREG